MANPEAPLGYDSLGLPVLDDEAAIQSLVDRLRAEALRESFREQLGPPNPNRIRDMLKEDQRNLPAPKQNLLSSPVQVAARGDQIRDAINALGRMFGALSPEQQAVQTARSMVADVPLEQAREFERAVMEAQAEQARETARGNAFGNLVSQPQVDINPYAEIDQMIADQLAAEIAADGEASLAAMEAGRESALATPAFSAPFSEESLTANAFKEAWGNPVDDWAEPAVAVDEEPAPMSTPFGIALGTLGENVDVNPLSGQIDPFGQHVTAALGEEDDPWGENPFSMAEPAFSVPAMTTVASNAFGAARAELAEQAARAQAEAEAGRETARGRAFGNIAAPAMSTVAPNAFANAVAALAPPAAAPPNMAAIDEEAELGAAMQAAAQAELDAILGPVPDVFTDIEESEAEREAYAAMEEARGSAFGNLTSPAVQTVAPNAFGNAQAELAAQAQQVANMANIGLSPEDIEAQAQAEAMANIGLPSVPAEDEEPAAPPAPPAMVTLEPALNAPFTQFAEPLSLSPEEEAEIAEAIAAQEQAASPFGSAPAGAGFGRANPALEQAFLENLAVMAQMPAEHNPRSAVPSYSLAPHSSPAAMSQIAANSLAAMQANFGAPARNAEYGNIVVATPNIASRMSAIDALNAAFGEHESEPALSPSLAAQSLGIGNLAPDPFGTFSGAQLGFDPYSDPMSTSMASQPSAPAGADDSGEDEADAPAAAPSMADLTGLSAAQDAAADPAPSDPAPSDAAPSDASSGDSSSSGGISDPASGLSGPDTSDPASGVWWKGGRVSRKAKPKTKSRGLAATPF